MAERDPIKRMREIELAKIELIDGATSTFLKELDRALSRANARMQRFIGDLEAGKRINTSSRNLARAVNAQAQIEEILLETGYRTSTERLVASYDQVARLTQQGLRAAGINEPFSQTDVRALTALKNLDLARWEGVGEELARTIQRSLLDSVVGGATVRELQDAIERQLLGLEGQDPAIRGRAKTLANTLSQSFDRAVTNRKAQTAGINTFVYLGPDDKLTRPFCEALLTGEGSSEFNIPAVDGDPPIYTAEQIEDMDNGTGLAVFQFGGGYNCRHKFRPIAVKVAEEALSA